MKTFLTKLSDMDRRDFLAYSAKAFLGVGLMPSVIRNTAFAADLPLSRPTAKNVIYLYMAGGMSHLDTFDLKQGTEFQGATRSIKTNVPGVRMSGYLPKLAQQMDKLAVINSMFSNQGAHEEGRYFMHSSYTKRGTIQHPGIGSWLVKFDGNRNPNLPGVVHIGSPNPGGSNGFLEQRYAPLVVGNPEAGLQNSARRSSMSEEEFQDMVSLTNAFDAEFHGRYKQQKKVEAYSEMYDDALKLMRSRDLVAFEIDKEPKSLRDSYGANPFGQGCLLARRLVEHDVRFVEVTLGNWDTHTNNFERVEENAAILDSAMATLLADLEVRGMLEETMVVLATEFGRTPKINENEGRDHSPTAFSCVLAGGGIRGGQVYGKTDTSGKNVVENRVNVPDFNATIAYALGIPTEKTVYSPTGRPFRVADMGRPVLDLFA
ncbi:DUF1501 domain-containing protein [Pelagicoccus enzymogenes]|uniref:DUF1501 domain-containing protein n=1 Tax=Pelagicoccus enzymogenes TaxID=2773457 RepID=UPI00280FDE5E|nr:DUF1501 domain-containing protein [Pelagicoccus enzymogenes]MDQ8201016.1 DUF1501 domain-containing protein [Pelagicoccus enzymogenes]